METWWVQSDNEAKPVWLNLCKGWQGTGADQHGDQEIWFFVAVRGSGPSVNISQRNSEPVATLQPSFPLPPLN